MAHLGCCSVRDGSKRRERYGDEEREGGVEVGLWGDDVELNKFAKELP